MIRKEKIDKLIARREKGKNMRTVHCCATCKFFKYQYDINGWCSLDGETVERHEVCDLYEPILKEKKIGVG
ncbi:MAG: hypothetical protein ACXQS8_06515 [Candidatus Helarchaeales archaeon]